VGVDGSPASLAAAETAAREAFARGRPLLMVHAFTWPTTHVHIESAPTGPIMDGLRHFAERILAEAADLARAAAPGVETTTAVITGEPLTVLEHQSRSAALLVVGSRGLGAFTGLLLGSVAMHLAAHSHCPVLVVRGRPDPTGAVLLGVDGSPAGEPAIGFAFAEASLRRAPLTALHAWNNWTHPVPAPPDKTKPWSYEPGMLQDDEERLLAEALSGWQTRYPEVTVEHRLVQALTRPALIEASAGAQLLVVGARGHGGFAGLLLGSVSQAVLHHAHCPVVVVPHALPEHRT
jgi:nucleotide-binding universal stress UspA family protein